MENPVLIIEAVELSDEAATQLHHFLNQIVSAFESHYHRQLNQTCSSDCGPESFDYWPEDGVPF